MDKKSHQSQALRKWHVEIKIVRTNEEQGKAVGQRGKYSAMEVKGSLFQLAGEKVLVTKNSEVRILIMVRFPGQLQKLI